MNHEKVIKDKDQKKSDTLNSADVARGDGSSIDPEDTEKIKLNEEREKAKLLRIEQREKEKLKGKGKKRSMDVDAVTRFTSSSSNPKRAKSEDEGASMEVTVEYSNSDDSQIGTYLHISIYIIYLQNNFFFVWNQIN